MTTTVEDLALQTECPECCSPAEFWCVTKTGNRARSLHTARTRLLWEAESNGYQRGYVNALDYAVDDLQERRNGSRWAMRSLVPLAGLDVVGWLRGRADLWRTR